MIELAFGESAGGALKMAKSLEGSGADVAAMTLALDIGDIRDTDTDMGERKKVLDDLFSSFPGVSDEIWETNQRALERLRQASATREAVRVWVCPGDPAELCGLYFVCHLLHETDTPLSAVFVPDRILNEQERTVVFYRSTGEMGPETFVALAEQEQLLSNLLRRDYDFAWRELARENAPLRAVVNGSLMGVPEDFYDFALRANLPDGEFRVALAIGKTLMQMPGVGDRWLFQRLQNMLRSGELVEVSPPTGKSPYSGFMKRSPS